MRLRSASLTNAAATALCAVLVLACSSDDESGDSSGSGGASGGEGGASGGEGGSSGSTAGSGGDAGSGGSSTGGPDPSECATTLEPSDDDTAALQTALIDASSGDIICLAPGSYVFTDEINLAQHQNVTLRGLSDNPDDVILEFKDSTGENGIDVTSDGFTIENMWVRNTPGNGVEVQADDSTFRNLKVTWDEVGLTENGAYAVYPTLCNRTIIEDVEVSGASDAGVYVGQCNQAIVRRVRAHGNVLGIEIENTIDADVYENELWDNSAGILVDLLPGKSQKESHNALVRDNIVRDNNRENFAPPGGVIAMVPGGTGIFVLAADDTEVRDNTISGNTGAAILILSYEVVEFLGSPSNDPETDKWPQRTYVHGNTFDNNGQAPTGLYGIVPFSTLENVLWDGLLPPATGDAGAATAADAELCLGTTEQTSFRNGAFSTFDASQTPPIDPTATSTDSTPHQCTLDSLPTLDF